MYENECDAMDKFMHEMCRPGFDYNGADLVSPKDGDEAEEDGVEHGSMKKKFVCHRQGKKKAKAPTSDTFTKTLELVAKKFQEELAASGRLLMQGWRQWFWFWSVWQAVCKVHHLLR